MLLRGYRRLILLFVLLTVINAAFFLCRELTDYQPHRTETSLYKAPSTEWNRYFTDFPVEGQQAAIRFTDSLLQGRDTSRLNQIQVIGAFLYYQFAPQLGRPSFQENYKDPWEMFQYYRADTSRKLWCGHLSMFFTYFCLARGIETRLIELNKPGDHHVVNECFLPGPGKWVLVDLTYDQLLVKKNDLLLGLTAFRKLQGRSDVLLNVRTANDSTRTIRMDTGYIRNYYADTVRVFYYVTVNPEKVYSITAKAKRYLWPDPWYYELRQQPGNQLFFYLRQAVLLTWLLVGGWLVLRWLESRKGRAKKN